MRIITILLFLLLLIPNISYAQSGDQPDKLFEQERLYKQLEKSVKEAQDSFSSQAAKPDQRIKKQGKCFLVKDIQIEGNRVLLDWNFDAIKFKYLNKCLYLSDINEISNEITGLYINQGYITAKAYIPEQNLNSGILKVTVVEGKLEKINFKSPNIRGEVQTAFPDLENSELNLRDVEQGLDQINRLKTNNAKVEILPGNKS